MPSSTSLHHSSYIKRIFLFSINIFPLKVEFSCYIRFKVCTLLKEKRNEIRLTRLFNYGSHHRYDFVERIRLGNDDAATLKPLMLFPLACKACDWLKEEFMFAKLQQNAPTYIKQASSIPMDSTLAWKKIR